MPLIWDFARQLDPAAMPGNTTYYFDEMCQSIYADGGAIRTQIGHLHRGQWADLEREPEIIISGPSYGVLDVEHHFNDTLYVTAQHGADVVLLVYDYSLDISSWLAAGTWQLQPDNPIKVGTVAVKNADRTKFEDDAHTLFSPGAKIRFNYSYGDSDPIPMGLFFIEDSPYSLDSEQFDFRGRNRLGFILSNQNIDERTHYAGTRTEVITQMLADSGVISAAIKVEIAATMVDYTAESSKNYFAVITEILAIIGWYMDDTPEGTIVIGSADYVKANAAKTGIYAFNLGADMISMSRTRQADGVYSRLCIRRKGADPLSIYSDIPYYEGWNIGAHRTYYQDVPDTTDQATMERIRDELVECMQYSGITETFKTLMQPQLQIGDVAVVVDGDVTRISGIISEVNHEFGQEGFFTTFTVTSGGTISDPDNPATVATKYVNRLGGANRQRRLSDYITGGASNTLTGTSITGDKGMAGTPGSDGLDGASAYDIWLSLGNSGTEQDFIDSLSVSTLPIGVIQLWPTASAPADWMLCDGQAISRTDYAGIFNLIGETYGVGDGTTTFNLPIIADPATGVSYMIKTK